MLEVFLERALQGSSSIYLCGSSPADFATALQAVLKHEPPNEHWLKLNIPPELTAADGMGAALRQDPDCIVLDQRGSECPQMLLRAAATGHRIICGHPLPPTGALECFYGCDPQFTRDIVAGVLQHSLFLEVKEKC